MPDNRRLLAVVTDSGLFGKLQGLISRSSFDINRVPSGTGALILAGNLPYDLILIESPLPDLDLQDFLAAIRTLDSPCAASAVLILHHDAELRLAETLKSDLVATLPAASPELELQKTLSNLLGVAARASRRLLVRVEAETGGDPGRLLQTENLSETGALLRGGTAIAEGSRLRLGFSLPGDGSRIHATAEVVRHAGPPSEAVSGIAVRFLDIEGDGRDRLRDFVAETAQRAGGTAAEELSLFGLGS